MGFLVVLKLLLLVKIEFHPEPSCVRHDVLGKRQNSVDVEVTEDRVVQFDLRECDLFTQLVPLALIGLPVN